MGIWGEILSRDMPSVWLTLSLPQCSLKLLNSSNIRKISQNYSTALPLLQLNICQISPRHPHTFCHLFYHHEIGMNNFIFSHREWMRMKMFIIRCGSFKDFFAGKLLAATAISVDAVFFCLCFCMSTTTSLVKEKKVVAGIYSFSRITTGSSSTHDKI